jgi:hypothetical protein
MQARTIIFSIIFCFTFFWGSHAAEKKNHIPLKETYDTSKVALRSFAADSIAKYKTDKDFDYNGAGAEYRETFWARIWNWIWEKILEGIGAVPYGGKIIGYTLLTGAFFFLVYFILKSSGIDIVRLLKNEPASTNVSFSESLENIHEINFDLEIEKAVTQHNYRLAVRLLYLKSLKQLNDLRLINWQTDKTNLAYVHELTEPSQKQIFGVLTKQFEYVWYGNFPIDQTTYINISSLFQEFKKQLR